MVKITFSPLRLQRKKNSFIHPHKTYCQQVQALLSFLNTLIFFPRDRSWDLFLVSAAEKNGRTEMSGQAICVMAGRKKNTFFS